MSEVVRPVNNMLIIKAVRADRTGLRRGEVEVLPPGVDWLAVGDTVLLHYRLTHPIDKDGTVILNADDVLAIIDNPEKPATVVEPTVDAVLVHGAFKHPKKSDWCFLKTHAEGPRLEVVKQDDGTWHTKDGRIFRPLDDDLAKWEEVVVDSESN